MFKYLTLLNIVFLSTLLSNNLCTSYIDISKVYISKNRDFLNIYYNKNYSTCKKSINSIDIIPNNRKNYVNFSGNRYFLQTISIFRPSLHSINNQYSKIEIEFTHKSSKDEILTISVLGKIGKSNRAFSQVLSSIESKRENKIELYRLILEDSNFFIYSGLTINNCERAKKIVLKDEITISKDELNRFVKIVNQHNRKSKRSSSLVKLSI